MARLLARVSLSYVQRFVLWAPLLFTTVFIAGVEIARRVVSETTWNANIFPSAAEVRVFGVMFFLWASSMALGYHLEEQLSNPRAPLLPHFRSTNRLAAAVWLAVLILLPGVVLARLWISPEIPLYEASIFFFLTYAIGLCALGLVTSYRWPAGIFVVILGLFAFFALLRHGVMPGHLALVVLMTSLLAILFVWFWPHKEKTFWQDVVSRADGGDQVATAPPVPGRSILASPFISFHDRRLDQLTAPRESTFWNRIGLWQMGLPTIRLWITVPIGAGFAWLLVQVATADARFSATMTVRSKLALGLSLALTLLISAICAWLVDAGRPGRLAAHVMRPLGRAQCALELGFAWVLHALKPWLILVAVPVLVSSVYLGRAKEGFVLLLLLGCAFVFSVFLSIFDFLVGRGPLSWTRFGAGLLNTAVIVASTALILFPTKPPTPILVSLWLAFGLMTAGLLYRRICSGDLE